MVCVVEGKSVMVCVWWRGECDGVCVVEGEECDGVCV